MNKQRYYGRKCCAMPVFGIIYPPVIGGGANILLEKHPYPDVDACRF